MKQRDFDLSKLREIGWSKWDPIGLGGLDLDWERNAPDEYDNYLIHVFVMLKQERTQEEAVGYLLHIAKEHMGLSSISTEKARGTVEAIQSYMVTLS